METKSKLLYKPGPIVTGADYIREIARMKESLEAMGVKSTLSEEEMAHEAEKLRNTVIIKMFPRRK